MRDLSVAAGDRRVATDFFERQAAARRSTLWLRLAFALAFVVMIGAVSFVALLATSVALRVSPAHAFTMLLRHPEAYLRFTLVVGLLMVAVALTRAWKLRAGGRALAEALGGRRIDARTADPDERRLLNVVDEMALAAHLPRPAVYLLDHEQSLNAFAAGRSTDDAAIGITAGALAAFDREELQALIGHELSHLLYGDTALNTRLLAWLHGLHAPTLFAKGMLRGKKGRFDPRAIVAWPLVVGLYLIGVVGTLLGRALQARISRRREQLADAAAVQFTRNPQALQSVLLKIAGSPGGTALDASDATTAAHMMFASVDLGWLSRIGGPVFATHPPLFERVRALDPALTEVRFRTLAQEARAEIRARRASVGAARAAAVVQNAAQRALAQPGTGGAVPNVALPATAPPPREPAAPPPAEARHEAAPPLDGLWHRLTLEQQRAVTTVVARHGDDAERLELLLIAALLAPVERARTAQLQKLAGVFGSDLAARIAPARLAWETLPAAARLAAIVQLLPRIGRADAGRRAQWLRVVRAYARLAQPADTTAFAITRVLQQTLAPRDVASTAKHPPLHECAAEIGVLLSLLAHQSGERAVEAYRSGLLDLLPPQRWPPLVPAPIDAARVDAAYAVLATLHVAARRAVCAGLARAVASDAVLSVAEADWLRATAVLLDVSTPVVRVDLRMASVAAG